MMSNNMMQARLWQEWHHNENHAMQWMVALQAIADSNNSTNSKNTRHPKKFNHNWESQLTSETAYHKSQVKEIRMKCQDLKREFYGHVKNQRVYQAKETIERLAKANEFNGT